MNSASTAGDSGSASPSRTRWPSLFFGNMHDMLRIIGAIGSAIVGTCLDTGHAYLSGDIYRIMYKLSYHLQLLHANDNRGRTITSRPEKARSIGGDCCTRSTRWICEERSFWT